MRARFRLRHTAVVIGVLEAGGSRFTPHALLRRRVIAGRLDESLARRRPHCEEAPTSLRRRTGDSAPLTWGALRRELVMAEAPYWRRCSSCKNPIGFRAQHWVCNVSTCN